MNSTTEDLLLPANMRGAKWANGVTYWSEDDRRRVVREVQRAKDQLADYSVPGYGPRTVGVRVASYTGEPHPLCIITHGPGGARIFSAVYR